MKSLKNKKIWIVPVYSIFYLLMFFALENRTIVHEVIYSPLDDRIPFCEYFIVPYALWFVYMIAVVIYFMFFNESSDEYHRLIAMLGTGMTIFLFISFVFPNCHYLRPVLPKEGNIFLEAVRFLYQIDTSTNLLPSIHVYNTLACFIAIYENETCRKKPLVLYGSLILSVLIILSTMFLKQHSVIDVTIAFVLYNICYAVIYKLIPAYKAKPRRKYYKKVI